MDRVRLREGGADRALGTDLDDDTVFEPEGAGVFFNDLGATLAF